MGGYVAMEMWRQDKARVQRLALLDTTALPDTPEATATRHALMDVARSQGMLPVAEALIERLIWPAAPGHAALAGIIRTMALNAGVDAFVRQETAIIGRSDSRDTLLHIDCPALVACGADDILTPPALHEYMAAQIPGATLQQFEDCGHLSTLERPEQVNQVLRAWLNRG